MNPLAFSSDPHQHPSSAYLLTIRQSSFPLAIDLDHIAFHPNTQLNIIKDSQKLTRHFINDIYGRKAKHPISTPELLAFHKLHDFTIQNYIEDKNDMMLQIEESIAKHRFCEQEILDALEHFERNLEVHGTLEGDGKGAEVGFYKETKESIEGLVEKLGPGREKDAIDMLKKELEREGGIEELLGGYTQGVVLAYLEWKKGEEERI